MQLTDGVMKKFIAIVADKTTTVNYTLLTILKRIIYIMHLYPLLVGSNYLIINFDKYVCTKYHVCFNLAILRAINKQLTRCIMCQL